MTASSLLRAARRSSGLGQADLARRSGTSQPDVSFVERGKRVPTVDTLERLLSGTGHRLVAVASAHPTSLEAGDSIAAALTLGRVDAAFRAFLDFSDGLAASEPVVRVVLACAAPDSTGSPVWDTALAAVAEYWLDRDGLPKPSWLSDPDRSLPSLRGLEVSVYDPEPDLDEVPEQFRRRNLLVERSTLASV